MSPSFAPSQLFKRPAAAGVRAGGARRLAWAEVCPAGWRARAYQRWRRGFSEASRLSLQPVIVSLCILVPGLMPSVRGCRSHGVADVVVGVVGACACWERAGMVGATTDAAMVTMPSPYSCTQVALVIVGSRRGGGGGRAAIFWGLMRKSSSSSALRGRARVCGRAKPRLSRGRTILAALGHNLLGSHCQVSWGGN